jgi:DNA-binding transcriptional ArsR family regulator
VSDDVGAVLSALADPTRRGIVEALLAHGTTSVPALTQEFPITRQALAKHLATLDGAGLLERLEPAGGREVHYRLRAGALHPTTRWLRATESAWDDRLHRLKRAVEDTPPAS